jgi:Alpha-galactosidase
MLEGFFVDYDEAYISDNNGLEIATSQEADKTGNGAVRQTTLYRSTACDIEIRNIITRHEGLNIVEKWIEIRNISNKSIKINRIDSIHGLLETNGYELKYFTSEWGKEFEPHDERLEGTKILESISGRSSMGVHPWFALKGATGDILVCSFAWSGNWIARFEPASNNCYRISGGLNNWCFLKVLKPKEEIEGIHVVYVYLKYGGVDDTSVEFGKWGKRYCYPQNRFSYSMAPEWNSWWPYEDYKLDEEVVKKNAAQCGGLGIRMCILDAGWFGPDDNGSFWGKVRGDWHLENKKRFPSGIRQLSRYIREQGLRFGIWCEIEAVGEDAELNVLHPELLAERDGKRLGYVCMGNPETRKWASDILETLIIEYGANWIKLDFNLNPGAGCNRTDHGHGEGDGLYEHYMGYYSLLAEIRRKYPEVVLENCSSGGLRMDLGMMKNTHRAFLSDPDYTEHHLQVFWGATTMLHPSVCLHFSWSQTLYDCNVVKEPIIIDMQRYTFDYYIRAALLGCAGFSYRLEELPVWCHKRLGEHIRFYEQISTMYIRDADMYRLTGQALRNGCGDRWNSFVFVTEKYTKALMFIFRLKGGEPERIIQLKGLEPGFKYCVEFMDRRLLLEKSGKELMQDGLHFSLREEESSEIVEINII